MCFDLVSDANKQQSNLLQIYFIFSRFFFFFSVRLCNRLNRVRSTTSKPPRLHSHWPLSVWWDQHVALTVLLAVMRNPAPRSVIWIRFQHRNEWHRFFASFDCSCLSSSSLSARHYCVRRLCSESSSRSFFAPWLCFTLWSKHGGHSSVGTIILCRTVLNLHMTPVLSGWTCSGDWHLNWNPLVYYTKKLAIFSRFMQHMHVLFSSFSFPSPLFHPLPPPPPSVVFA